MAAISTIRNLGPAMERALNGAGIGTAEELRAIGADAAYARLLQAGTRPHFISYYVLHMALQGRAWNDCKGAEKDALRMSFDQLKSGNCDPARTELERFLDQIGVVATRPGTKVRPRTGPGDGTGDGRAQGAARPPD